MFIVILWSAIVTSLVTVTAVREDCIKEKKCTIVPQEVGVSIEKTQGE